MANSTLAGLPDAASVSDSDTLHLLQGGTDKEAALALLRTLFTTVSVNPQTGTTYTVQASDLGKLITLTNASAITVTVPDLGQGFNCLFYQGGAGQVSFAEDTGVTLDSRGAATKIAGQHGTASVVFDTAGHGILSGDLTT